jgi:hypothetical protein
MEHIQETSNLVIERLKQLRYDYRIINKIKKVSKIDSKIYLRSTLEDFFRETARIAQELGVYFDGNWKSPSSVREFLRRTGRLTSAEHEFVKSYYGLLSDSAAHPGASYVELEFAIYMFWYSIDLVSYRMEKRYRRRSCGTGPSGTPLDSIQIEHVCKTIDRIRRKMWNQMASIKYFNRDQMQLARKILTKTDAQVLMELIKDTNANNNLRKLAVSLILATNIIQGDEELKGNLIKELRIYYQTHKNDKRQFPVLRGIALALSNRVYETDCIMDYISKLKAKQEILEKGLKISEQYYGGIKETIEDYVKRLNNPEMPAAACIWEVFYLGKRANKGDKKVIGALIRCRQRTDEMNIITLCDESIDMIDKKRRK